jgi:hypothetical protein
MPTKLAYHPEAIYCILRSDKVTAALEAGECVFQENRRWNKAGLLFEAAKRNKQQLVVLLGNASDSKAGVRAYGFVKHLEIEDQQTTITLKSIQPVPGPAYPLELLTGMTTGEDLAAAGFRSYRFIELPDFLTRQPSTFVLTFVSEYIKKDRPTTHEGWQQWLLARPWWSFQAYQLVQPGDRLLVLRQGAHPGIIAAGWVGPGGAGWEKAEGKRISTVEVRIMEALEDIDKGLDAANLAGTDEFHWQPRNSGKKMDDAVAAIVWEAWQRHLSSPQTQLRPLLAVTDAPRWESVRLYQSAFREAVRERCHGRCVLTGCEIRELLEACHIKPAKHCDEAEKQDPQNGLLLTPTWHALLDSNLMTFSADGVVRLTKSIPRSQFADIGIRGEYRLPSGFATRNAYFAWQRQAFAEAEAARASRAHC